METLVTRSGKVTAVGIYTFKRGGRKAICSASDGTPEGKEDLYKIFSEDWKMFDRTAWAETSGKAFGTTLKTGGVPVPVQTAIKLLPDKNMEPIDDYFYRRKIGTEIYVKCLVGNAPGIKKQFPLTQDQKEEFKRKSLEYAENMSRFQNNLVYFNV